MTLADTLVVVLLFTVPSHNALVVDSTTFECSGGTETHDVDSLHVFGYRIPANGKGFQHLFVQSERGREGQPDSVKLRLGGWTAGNFYVLVKDTVGNPSCGSNVVFKGITTDIPVDFVPSHEPTIRWFNVAGQLLPQGPRAFGVYFYQLRLPDDRWTRAKKFTYRGMLPSFMR